MAGVGYRYVHLVSTEGIWCFILVAEGVSSVQDYSVHISEMLVEIRRLGSAGVLSHWWYTKGLSMWFLQQGRQVIRSVHKGPVLLGWVLEFIQYHFYRHWNHIAGHKPTQVQGTEKETSSFNGRGDKGIHSHLLGVAAYRGREMWEGIGDKWEYVH